MVGYKCLQQALIDNNIDYKSLADVLHVSEFIVKEWCEGVTSIPVDKLADICCVLNINPFSLMGVDSHDESIYYELVYDEMCFNMDLMPYLSTLPSVNLDIFDMMVNSMRIQYDLDNNTSLSEDDKNILRTKQNDIISNVCLEPSYYVIQSFLDKHYKDGDLFVQSKRRFTKYGYLLSLVLKDVDLN